MYYLIIGKEQVFNNNLRYYYDGNFTADELKNKVKEAYSAEYEIDEEFSTITKKSDTYITEPESNFNFSFSYIFKSETPITELE